MRSFFSKIQYFHASDFCSVILNRLFLIQRFLTFMMAFHSLPNKHCVCDNSQLSILQFNFLNMKKKPNLGCKILGGTKLTYFHLYLNKTHVHYPQSNRLKTKPVTLEKCAEILVSVYIF